MEMLTETQVHLSDTIDKLAVVERKLKDSLFRLESFKHDDALIKFYTGFHCYNTLKAFFRV